MERTIVSEASFIARQQRLESTHLTQLEAATGNVENLLNCDDVRV
jgi:hypothetical protein